MAIRKTAFVRALPQVASATLTAGILVLFTTLILMIA
jgi:hypothetical protein